MYTFLLVVSARCVRIAHQQRAWWSRAIARDGRWQFGAPPARPRQPQTQALPDSLRRQHARRSIAVLSSLVPRALAAAIAASVRPDRPHRVHMRAAMARSSSPTASA